jgi:hypothetical protein
MLDFKKFDIIMVSGFKGKSISVEKIVRTTIDQLRQQAGSKYDQEMTVIKAKALRLKNDTSQTQTATIETSESSLESRSAAGQPSASITFKLPDNAGKLNELVSIVTANTGNQEIIIGSKTFFLNEIGIEKIKDLLS